MNLIQSFTAMYQIVNPYLIIKMSTFCGKGSKLLRTIEARILKNYPFFNLTITGLIRAVPCEHPYPRASRILSRVFQRPSQRYHCHAVYLSSLSTVVKKSLTHCFQVRDVIRSIEKPFL